MGRFEKQMRRFTSLVVLVCFLTTLMAPALEAAALIPVKVPGRQVLFDVNTATAQELASIPGIGPKTAAEIVRYRSQFGPFKSIQDVGNVSGVGKARLSKLVSGATQAARPDLLLKQSPVKPAAAPAPAPVAKPVVVTPEPPAVWVTGSNGARVNVNVSNSKALVTQLVKAGFPNEQVNILANTRLVGNGSSLKFQPFKNLADLQTRLVSVGGKGIVDVAGAQIVQRAVSAPAAPSEPAVQTRPVPGVDGQALVYNSGERLMFRFDAGGKAVTVNLNQQSAAGLYKQLRAAGVPTSTAKAVAAARIKGTFKSFSDLTSRVPQMDSVSRPVATRSAVTEPAAPAQQTPAAAPAAPGQAAEAQLAKLSKQYEAIVKRTPTSDTGYQRTIKSLQDTYDGMFKSLAEKAAAEGKVANADALAKDARLQRIAKDIDSFSRNQQNLAKAQNVNKAAAVLDTELAKYSKQADAIIKRSPTSLEGYNRTLDSLQNTYKDLYSRLEMKARLSGADVSAEALVKDPRMQKVAQAIDSVRTQKAEFQSTKTANVEQARANEAKAAARKAAAPTAETPAAPVEEAPVARQTPQESAAAAKSRVEYTTRINEMSAQAKQLFTEIKAESGGRFTSNRDVWEAAKSYDGKGKLADLRKLGSNIQQMRQARNAAFPAEQPAVKEAKAPAPAKAKAAPVAEEPAPVKQAKATAPAETPAAPASEPQAAKPLTEIQKLSQQAKALNAKLLQGGQFKSAQEVYKASEVPGAQGELAQLKQVNEQIRSMRSANKPVSQVAETPAGSAKASVIGDAAAPTETAAPKAKWTDGFLKAVKGGQFKSTDGGWADSYMKMLKGDGVVETARTATGPKASEIAAPTVEKAAPSGGWADTYVKMLKGELVADAAAPAATPKQSWWNKLFGRRTASVPTAEAPAGRVAELPTELPADLPKASELGSTPARPTDVKASITDLQGQASALRLKIKSTGQFTNSGEIYKASEAAGATGDLAALKAVNDQIRSLRAAKPGATAPVAEPTVNPVENAPAEAVAPKTNKFMDWLTGKNAPGRKLLGGKTAAPATESPVAEPTAKPVETAPAEAAAPKTNKFMDWLTGKNSPGGKLLGGKTAAPAAEAPVTEPTAKPVETAGTSGKTVSPSAESPASLGRSVGTPVEAVRGSSIAELPVEASTAKPATVAKIEAIDTQISNLRTQAHETASSLVKSGQFENVAEVAKAAQAPGATGKVAEVGQLNQNIKSLNIEKATVANAAPAPSEGSGLVVAGKGLAEVTGAAGSSTSFAVKFGNKVSDLGQMTAKQIEAETGGLINGNAAKKIADTAAANGGKLSVNDLSKLGLTDDVVSTLRRGNTDAVKTQLTDARAKAVEKFGADSEVVKKIDSNLEQLKGQSPNEPKASVTGGGNADVLAARTTQLETVNAKIAQLEGKTGLLAKFTKGKQLKALYEQKSTLEKEIQGYKEDPSKLDTANKAYQQKNQKVFAEQARQVGVLEAELAKVDPNSRYGRALTERIDQIRASAPESFGKQATNMFLIAAGTNILMSLAKQIKNGEKIDLGAAVKSIANPQFLLGTAGAAIGAYAGTKFAFSKLGLILTTKLGSFLPPVGRVFLQMLPAMAGGALGSTLLSGGFAEADWLEIGATTLGSTLGTALAATFFPGMGIFGQISAGMMGAEVAKFILKMVRGDPESETASQSTTAGGAEDPNGASANAKASALASNFTEKDVADAFNAMSIYYQRYVQFEKDGNYGDAAQAYEKYAALKARLDEMRNASFQARAK